MPHGAWNILVDKDCRRITHRAAEPGDMMARAPVQTIYGGTIPGFQPSSHQSDTANIQQRIDYELRAGRNKELFEQAVFLLSQTPDGRRLLHAALNNKFKFVFDPGRTAAEDVAGGFDDKNKLIPLAEGYTPEAVALIIKHELQHMEDARKGLVYGLQDTLASATIADRGLEANARVSEAVFAMEAMLGDPEGPDSQFRTYAVMAHHHRNNPEMGNAALNNRDLIKTQSHAEWAAWANKVFPAYYQNIAVLARYDEKLARMYAGGSLRSPDELRAAAEVDPAYKRDPGRIERHLAEMKKSMDGIMQQTGTTGADLSQKLTIRGLPYLKFDRKFNPESEALRGITAQGMDAFDKLKTRIMQLGVSLTDEAAAALDKMPQHRSRPASKYLPGKFAAAIAARPETPFTPIVLPYRLDGNKDTKGTREYANVTEKFSADYNKVDTSTSPLDKIEFAVTAWLQNGTSGNIKSRISALAEAGLRAPVSHLICMIWLHV